jgi:hypothetical protein
MGVESRLRRNQRLQQLIVDVLRDRGLAQQVLDSLVVGRHIEKRQQPGRRPGRTRVVSRQAAVAAAGVKGLTAAEKHLVALVQAFRGKMRHALRVHITPDVGAGRHGNQQCRRNHQK